MMTLLELGEQVRRLGRCDWPDLTARHRGRRRRRALGRAEAAGDHRDEVAVHGAAHDVAQDRTRGAHQSANHDQKIVRQHEAGRRRRPAGVAVQHRDHHRHISAADGHNHVHAEGERDHRHHDEREHAGAGQFSTHKEVTEHDDDDEAGKIDPVARRQQDGLAADPSRELAEGDHRAGERHSADEHAKIDLDQMDRVLGMGRKHRRGVDVAGVADGAGGQADQRVHDRHQLRHLRHPYDARRIEPKAAADAHCQDDDEDAHDAADDRLFAVRQQTRAEHGGQHRNCHAGDTEPVAALGGFRVRQAAEAQDEKNRGPDIGDRDKTYRHSSGPLISGTSPACGGSLRNRRTC